MLVVVVVAALLRADTALTAVLRCCWSERMYMRLWSVAAGDDCLACVLRQGSVALWLLTACIEHIPRAR